MTTVHTYSTAQLPPKRRLDYWNQLTGDAITALVVEPVDARSFAGELTRTAVGCVELAEVYSEPAVVRHLKEHVAAARDARFVLCLQLQGASVTRQQGREALLRDGDFTLLDSSRPYQVSFDRPNRALVLGVPHADLSRRLVNAEALVGLAMPGDVGMSGLLSSFLRGLWQQQRNDDNLVLTPRLGDAVIDLIAGAYTSRLHGVEAASSWAVSRREHIRGYIEQHLHDPSLTPSRIAVAARLSPRRMHQLFESTGETIGCYILRRRIEECARVLADCSQQGRAIAEIAFQHGFNNASHFGRAFRDRYGWTPSEYRRRMATPTL